MITACVIQVEVENNGCKSQSICRMLEIKENYFVPWQKPYNLTKDRELSRIYLTAYGNG